MPIELSQQSHRVVDPTFRVGISHLVLDVDRVPGSRGRDLVGQAIEARGIRKQSMQPIRGLGRRGPVATGQQSADRLHALGDPSLDVRLTK